VAQKRQPSKLGGGRGKSGKARGQRALTKGGRQSKGTTNCWGSGPATIFENGGKEDPIPRSISLPNTGGGDQKGKEGRKAPFEAEVILPVCPNTRVRKRARFAKRGGTF